MRTEITNKAYTITRCIEAVRYARDQMRTIKGRNEKIKKRKNPGTDKVKKRHEGEVKEKDEKIGRTENYKKTLVDNIANLEEQINNLKNDTNVKYDKVTSLAKENNKKIKDLKDENNKLKYNHGKKQ